MLTDTEKERIRLEEHYRKELREQLSAPKPNSLWTFLNSSFGVWILSALFITGMGAAITRYQESRTVFQKNKEAIERLDLEIGYRFSQVQVHLYAASLLPETEREPKTQAAIKGLNLPPNGDYQYLFPDYAAFSIPALIAELRRRDESPGIRERLARILAHLTGLQVFFKNREAPLADPKQVAGVIIEDLVLGRWKAADWYFLDGSKESPFP